MALGRQHTDSHPVLRRVGKRRLIVIATAVVALLAVAAGGTAYALLGRDTPAVLITPASSEVSNSYTLSAVTSTPNASQNQVSARLLSTNTPAQTKTVKASGHLSLQAAQAHGMLIIYNWDKAPKTFKAGTVLPFLPADEAVTCGDAVSGMVLDTTVTVPAGTSSDEGYETTYVPAHVQEAGSSGNIPAGWGPLGCSYFIWANGSRGSCPDGWFGRACTMITTASAFTGGQDAYNGPIVQQSDIDSAANALTSANRPNPQRALQRQMQPGEQFIGTPACTPQISPNQPVGAKAAQVMVSVYFTCTGEVYNQKAAFALAASMLTTQAADNPGKGYALVGTIKTALTSVVFGDQGNLTLTIAARGVWAYQFTDAQQQQLARLLAGKSEQEAVQLASSQPGVAYVTVHLLANQQRLPTDPQQIKIVIQALPD